MSIRIINQYPDNKMNQNCIRKFVFIQMYPQINLTYGRMQVDTKGFVHEFVSFIKNEVKNLN